MKISKSIIIAFILLIFIPTISALNMSSDVDNYNTQFSMGSISLIGDDGTNFNLSGQSTTMTGNMSDSTGEYDWSFMSRYGSQNIPNFIISSPTNLSTASVTLDLDFDYLSQDDFGWLNCYYLLNADSNDESTNITFACNSSNLTITMVDEKWNQLEFFVNDSMPQTFEVLYRFWINASGTGTPDQGEGGGGGTTITNPLTRPKIDPFTNETLPAGYPSGNPFAQLALDGLEATRQVIRSIGGAILPEREAVGFLLMSMLILIFGIIYKNSRFIYRGLFGEDKNLKKQKNKIEKKESKDSWGW